MKKILCLLLAVIMCISLVACGSQSSCETPKESETKSVESVESKVRSAVQINIGATVGALYDTVGVPNVTCYINEISENYFEVSGKVTAKDKYGDSYSGKYDCTVKYNPETDKCKVSNHNIGDLYKVK